MNSIDRSETDVPAQFVDRYLDAQLSHDRSGALTVIDEALAAGISVASIYLDILQPCQYELGRLWESNRITVAQEHIGTGITQFAIAHLYSHLPRAAPNGKIILIACVEGELHDVGARMVADFCEMHGFDVVYVGANVPSDSLITMITETRPDMIGLSVTMSYNIPTLRDLAHRIEATLDYGGTMVVGGGGLRWIGSSIDQLPCTVSMGDTLRFITQLAGARLGEPDASQ